MKTLFTMKKRNMLITGPPGCGKSTLIEKIINRMEEPVTGFFTREIKERGRRVGFSINTLDGREGILAHKSIRSEYRVGKYGINIEDIDNIAIPSIMPRGKDVIVVIDEIGKMECFSLLFRNTLMRLLNAPHWIIGSIAQKGGRFIQSIKERNDVRLIHISAQNRNMLVEKIIDYTQRNRQALL